MDGYDQDLSIVSCPLSDEDATMLEHYLDMYDDPIEGFMEWLCNEND